VPVCFFVGRQYFFIFLMTTAVTQWEQLFKIQKHNYLEQKEIDCVDQLLTSWNLTQGGVCMHCLFDKLEKKKVICKSKKLIVSWSFISNYNIESVFFWEEKAHSFLSILFHNFALFFLWYNSLNGPNYNWWGLSHCTPIESDKKFGKKQRILKGTILI